MAHVEPMVEQDEHPSLDSTINEENSNASKANKDVIISYNSPLRAYIDEACSIIGPPPHVGEREIVLPW